MKLILATHGKFAQELLGSANMIYGQIDDLDVVTFLPGENTETLKAKYRQLIAGYQPDEEVLFLVDLFGGSPYNAAFEVAACEERMDVITGLSLPLLIEVAEIRDSAKVSELYEKLDTQFYVKSCKALLKEETANQKEDDEL